MEPMGYPKISETEGTVTCPSTTVAQRDHREGTEGHYFSQQHQQINQPHLCLNLPESKSDWSLVKGVRMQEDPALLLSLAGER